MPRSQATVLVDDRVVCDRCVVADHPVTRMRGLLGRSDLPRGEGILLRPARSIHTFFMRFPIDVVFLDSDDVVLQVVRELRPWRAAGVKGSHTVLELAGGEAQAHGIEAGTRLVFDPEPSKIDVAFREAAQTLSEYVLVLVVISATIMTALAVQSGVVATLIQLAADIYPSS
jgi:uncharacterized membrane protein (UPF0127 family)